MRHWIVPSLLVGCCALASASAEPVPPLAWEVVSQETPPIVWANMKRAVVLRLRNAGTATWNTETGDHLSYHWLTPDGQMVVRDGLRTAYPHEVLPGEVVEVRARVQAPPDAGRYLLEWEPVRELVRWYGPPLGAERLRIPVLVTWRCAWFGVGLAVATLVLGVGGRLAARRRPETGWWWRALVPVVWTWATVQLVTVAFSELVGRQLWSGADWLAASASALVAVPVALVPVRARTWVALTVAALATATAAADLLYLRWFGNLVPVEALAAARQLDQVEGSVRSLFVGTDAWLAPALLAGVLLVVVKPRIRAAARPPGWTRLLVAGATLVGVGAAALPAAGALCRALNDPATARQVFSQQQLVGQWGVVNLHLLDIGRALRRVLQHDQLPPQRLAEVKRLFRERAAAGPSDGTGWAVARGCNLVLVQAESLQGWVIGARVGGVEITPFLNSISARGLYFSGVFDQTAEGRSSDGEFVTLNSLLPLPRGAVAFLHADNRFHALPAVLREHGYATLSAHAFERGFWNRATLHPRYGFERSLFQRELGTGEVIGWGLADGPFLQRMVPHLARLPQPFFAFLITLGLHHPFDRFPARHRVLEVGELAGTPLGNYIHSMHYLDEQLRRFVAALEGAGLLDHTVVAVYGDHESGLGIDANLLRLLGIAGWKPTLPLKLRRVPLLVLLPGTPFTGEVREVGGHTDIAPTLLHLLGLPRPPSFLGSALQPGRNAVVAIPGGSAVGRGLIFAARGPAIPDGGACFSYADGSARPLAECRPLAEEARAMLEACATVLEWDLVPLLAAPEP